MIVYDLILHVKMYVEDVSKCGLGVYIRDADWRFTQLGDPFTLNQQIQMSGNQMYSFYSDELGFYDFPLLDETNFNTRTKFKWGQNG